METLTDHVLRAVPREQLMIRLGRARQRTSRQVNTLEQTVAASLTRERAAIARTLQERERGEQVRLRHLRRSREGPGL